MSAQTETNRRRKTQASAPAGVEELTTAECWRLVETSTLGRLAVEGIDGRPDLFPLNFLVHDGNLFVRSAPGKKLRSITEHPDVAFEVDGVDERFHWSVVIKARAERMDTDADIEASGILELISLSPTPKHNFLRLTPVAVTGRRFPKAASPAPTRSAAPAAPDVDEQSAKSASPHPPTAAHPDLDDKPNPIPHHAPLPH